MERIFFIISLFIAILCNNIVKGQPPLIINFVNVESGHTPDILNVQIINNGNQASFATISGKLKFKSHVGHIAFEYKMNINPGVNNLHDYKSQIKLKYATTAIKQLYEQHNLLPYDNYEYCITVNFQRQNSEMDTAGMVSDCYYFDIKELFLIDLLNPSDNEIIQEYYPALSWIVNSPLMQQLDYRLKLTPVKANQNAADAIQRNRLQLDQRQIKTTLLNYPMSAKPLEANQKYAWTVEAYYNNLLLGVAKPWLFEIKDTLDLDSVLQHQSYININSDVEKQTVFVSGFMKLKYELIPGIQDTLVLELYDDKNKLIKLRDQKGYIAVKGDNRYIIDFVNVQPLRHKKQYTLHINSKYIHNKKVHFTYLNPYYN